MNPPVFDIGDIAILQVKFGVPTVSTDPATTFVVDGVYYLLTDTASGTCKVMQPDGTEAVVALSNHVSTGIYEGRTAINDGIWN